MLPKLLTGYINKNTGAKMSDVDYHYHRQSCLGRVWNDIDGVYEYSSLEEEFECRKKQEWLNEYTPEYEERGHKVEDVQYIIVGSLEDTGSPYIETPFVYGNSSWSRSSGMYRCNLTKAAFDRYKEHESTFGKHFKFTNDGYRHYLHFAKINGNYIFSGESPFKDNCFVYTSTLEDAKVKIKQAIDAVDTLVMPIVCPITIDTLFVSDILKSVKSLQGSCISLEVKQSSKTTKLVVLDKLKEIVYKLNAALSDAHIEDVNE